MTTLEGTPRLRASDDERAETVRLLQDAIARGQLTHDEGDERMGTAFAARYRDELPPLTVDLPGAQPATPAPAAATGWRGLLIALVTLVRAEFAATVAAGLRSRRFVLTALVVLALVAGLTLAVGHGFWDGGHEHLADHDGS
jgi:hypothetical protein